MSPACNTLINGIVFGVALILFGILGLGGWLLSYRLPKAAPIGPGRWMFALPRWVQISGWLAISIFCGYLGYVLWLPLPLSVVLAVSIWLRLAGLAVFLVGASLVFWARCALGVMWGVSTSFAVQMLTEHRLIRHGPYAFVRHPMYLGYWLTLFGILLIYRTWTALFLFVLCLVSFYLRARREEKALASAFGKEWKRYAMRTKFLIPLMY